MSRGHQLQQDSVTLLEVMTDPASNKCILGKKKPHVMELISSSPLEFMFFLVCFCTTTRMVQNMVSLAIISNFHSLSL